MSLQFLRGLAAGIPTAADGEPLWATDTKRLYLGQGGTNYPVVMQNDLASGIFTWLATPTSANLRTAMTDESGTGALLFAGGNMGTPSAIVLSNGTGLPQSGVTNLTSDLALKAPLASPTLTGSPVAPTASINDNSTKLATTAYVDRQAASGTKVLTNTTLDTAGSGNVFKIAGTTISANTGSGNNVLATSPTIITGTFSGYSTFSSAGTYEVITLSAGSSGGLVIAGSSANLGFALAKGLSFRANAGEDIYFTAAPAYGSLSGPSMTIFGASQNISFGLNAFIFDFATSRFGFATTTPTAIMHLGAGIATAGHAPMKFTLPGVPTTTPEAGALETDADHLYYTITTGNVRKLIALTLTATATLDFGNTSAQSSADLTISVTGAAVGDAVAISTPASPDANSCFTAWVSATNTVTIRFNNYSSGAINPASGTYRATVFNS